VAIWAMCAMVSRGRCSRGGGGVGLWLWRRDGLMPRGAAWYFRRRRKETNPRHVERPETPLRVSLHDAFSRSPFFRDPPASVQNRRRRARSQDSGEKRRRCRRRQPESAPSRKSPPLFKPPVFSQPSGREVLPNFSPAGLRSRPSRRIPGNQQAPHTKQKDHAAVGVADESAGPRALPRCQRPRARRPRRIFRGRFAAPRGAGLAATGVSAGYATIHRAEWIGCEPRTSGRARVHRGHVIVGEEACSARVRNSRNCRMPRLFRVAR